MECIEYDHEFAQDLATGYAKWKTGPTEPKEARKNNRASSQHSITEAGDSTDEEGGGSTAAVEATIRRSGRVRRSSEKALWLESQDDVDMLSDLTDLGDDDDGNEWN